MVGHAGPECLPFRPTGAIGGIISAMDSHDEAQARLERLFARFEGVGAPVWSGDLRSVSGANLERARDRAIGAATKADRLQLLDDALEFVDRGYAHRVSRDTAWTGILGVGPSYDGRYRAESQVILEDLVLATVVLDVAPESVTEPLRADGERLLRIEVEEAHLPLRESDGEDDDGDDGTPPPDATAAPMVFNTRWIPLALLGLMALSLLGAGVVVGTEGLAAVLLVFGVVWLLRRAAGR